MLAVLLSGLGGNKKKLEDFLPKRISPKDEKPGTISDVMNILKGSSDG